MGSEVKILDTILHIVNDCDGAELEDLIMHAGNYGCPEIKRLKLEEFNYFLNILEKNFIVNVLKFKGGFNITPIPYRTENFIENGGFKRIFNENEEEKKLKIIEDEKLINDSKFVKLQLKIFWPMFIIALIGGISGIISLIWLLISES